MCPQVTLGLRPSEQLLWSFQNHVAIRHGSLKPGPFTSNKAFALGSTYLYVLLTDCSMGSPTHHVQRYVCGRVAPGGRPFLHDFPEVSRLVRP